mgnify:FL=1
MSNWVLETKALTRKYKEQTAVDAINIHVSKGQIYGLLGRNGAGKTTTLRMIMGLVKPTTGEIEIFGQNIQENAKQIYPRVGSIIEIPGFYENLTAN